MQKEYVINGVRVVMDKLSSRESTGLLDVTPVGEAWKKWVWSGQKRLELHGTTTDGEEIHGIFRIVGQLEDGTPVLEPWSDIPTVGREE